MQLTVQVEVGIDGADDGDAHVAADDVAVALESALGHPDVFRAIEDRLQVEIGEDMNFDAIGVTVA